MTDHQIQATYKFGKDYDEAWTTIAADDPDEWQRLNNAFRDQLAQQISETAQFVRAANVATRSLGATAVQPQAVGPGVGYASNPQDNNPPGGHLTVVAPASTQPAYVPPAPAQAPPTSNGAPLPADVRFWKAPDPKKPQYDALWFQFPYIQDAGARDAFMAPIKATTWAKFDGTQKAWYTMTKHEDYLRQAFSQNAHLFV